MVKLLAVTVAMATFCVGEGLEAQSPPIRIASIKLADEEGRTGRGRQCLRPLVARAHEPLFLVTVLENVTGQTQSYSLGRNWDGQGVFGGGSGSIDAGRRSLLAEGDRVFTPGLHNVVITLCTIESFPCGDGVDDEVLEQVTFEFHVRE